MQHASRRRPNRTSLVGHRLRGWMRLIKRLLNRRGNPAPLADVVAMLAGPLPHSTGLLTGLPTATSSGAATTTSAPAPGAALDPGRFP